MADTDGEHGIWLVVPPAFGLPVFLAAVAVIALLVHVALVSKTQWFGKYWEGNKGAITSVK